MNSVKLSIIYLYLCVIDYGTQPHDVQGPSDNYQPLQEGGVPGAGKNYFILNLSKLPVSFNAIC